VIASADRIEFNGDDYAIMRGVRRGVEQWRRYYASSSEMNATVLACPRCSSKVGDWRATDHVVCGLSVSRT
jgi:hypothetical protein